MTQSRIGIHSERAPECPVVSNSGRVLLWFDISVWHLKYEVSLKLKVHKFGYF
jgi:hypothetical protein